MKSALYLPVAKGLDQSTDERVASADVPLRLENCQFDQRGALVKRGGFVAMPTAHTGGIRYPLNSARALISTGAELCVISNHRLFAYDALEEQWRMRGPVAPACGRSETIFRDETWYMTSDADVDQEQQYVMYLAQRFSQEKDGSFSSQIVATVHAVDTTTTVPLSSEAIASGSYTGQQISADYPHAVRVVGKAGGHLGFWLAGTESASLEVCDYDTSFPSEPPAHLTQLLAPGSVWVDTDASTHFTVRTYDVVAIPDGGYLVAHIDFTTRDIVVSVYDDSLTLENTTSIEGGEDAPWTRVALEIDPDPLNNRCFVLGVREGAIHSVIAYCLRTSSLTVTWGPKQLQGTTDDTQHYTNVGMRLGSTLGVDYLACVWTWYDTDGSTSSRYYGGTAMERALVDPDTGTPTSEIRRHTMSARVKPWSHEEHFYVGAHTACTASMYSILPTGWPDALDRDLNIIDSHIVMELPDQQLGADYVLCGVYDVGTAATPNEAHFDIGNCQRSFEVRPGVFRWLEHESEPRGVQVSEIEYDYTRAPLACVVSTGSVVIGGAYVAWYDGDRVVELGHVHPPMPHRIDKEWSFLGSFDDGDEVAWHAVWYSFDANGVLHRSLPTFRFTATMGIQQTARSFLVMSKTCGATNRLRGTDYGVALYREEFPASTGSSGLPKRINRTYSADVNADAIATEGVVDRGKTYPLYDVLYTAGGEIEAVCPEGARIPVVVNGRLFLGGFFRRHRVQFSKPLAPGTASEYAIAPEFNEGFGFVFDSGTEVTGISFLDQDALLLTRDAIYLNSGEGPTDAGVGNDFSGPKRISSDSGCKDPRSVVSTPAGVLFQSDAGIYLVDRGRQVKFIGEAVKRETDAWELVTSAVLVADRNQIRFTLTDESAQNGIVLVYDYIRNAWLKWTPRKGSRQSIAAVSACVHNGDYYIVDRQGQVWRLDESVFADDETNAIDMVVETGWVQADQHGGWQRCQNAVAMMRALGDAEVTLEVFTDFDDAGGSAQSHTWANADLSAFPRYPECPVLVKLIDQKSSSVRLRLTESSTTRGVKMTGWRLDLVKKRGPNKVAPSQRA